MRQFKEARRLLVVAAPEAITARAVAPTEVVAAGPVIAAATLAETTTAATLAETATAATATLAIAAATTTATLTEATAPATVAATLAETAAPATLAEATTATHFLTGAGFVHFQYTAFKLSAVQFGDCRLTGFSLVHLHEPKAARLARLTVLDDNGRLDFTKTLEERTQVGVRDRVGQVSDIDIDHQKREKERKKKRGSPARCSC